jgi:regulator of sirC expression with transglutaminase-like and TPR domain
MATGNFLQLDPKHLGALNNRGAIYLERGNAQAALADFQRVMEIDPN